jgi:hypothetical protein
MVVCRWIGYPNLFLTFTCNAKWPEIQYMIDESMLRQKPADQADIVVRVFMIKLRELLWDIVKGKRFGKTLAGKHKNDFSYSFLVIISDFYFFLQFCTQ